MEAVRLPDEDVRAIRFWVANRKVYVETEDGREAAVPAAWHPRLAGASDSDLQDFRTMGGGRVISWPQLEESLGVVDILKGVPGYQPPTSELSPRAERLRVIRKGAGLTQIALAFRLGCSQALVSMAESGTTWVGAEWEGRVKAACDLPSSKITAAKSKGKAKPSRQNNSNSHNVTM